MAQDFSFDIECQFDLQKLKNALEQTKREIQSRYDFKNVTAEVDLSENNSLIITTESDYKIQAIKEILHSKLVKQDQSPKILDWSKVPEKASGMNIRQHIPLIKALSSEQSKQIQKLIKESGEKVKANIQGETIRISSPSKNSLQSIIQLLKDHKDIDIPLQFVNFR